ncbi:MAG TPA: IucA/IucC family protein [Micromonosporaceae bacterium]|nr:IucA/IucC family protein [Micromonosporaceae bacterium]
MAPAPVAPDLATTAASLAAHRPELLPAYRAALAGARSAVLARLWGACAREPLPGLASRSVHGEWLTCWFSNGSGGRAPADGPGWALTGPRAAAEPFAAPARLSLSLASPAPSGAPLSHVPDDRRDQDGREAHDARHFKDPAQLVRALGLPGGERLAAELANSVANLALARATQPAPDPALALATLTGAPPLLEQCVVDGHPLHPGCRTRLGMSTVEVLRYAPEHRPAVRLVLAAVPAEELLATGDWPERLRAGGCVLLPVHPWQAEHVLPDHPGLRRTAATLPAYPLMSLRTLATADGAWHVKTAVDVQMTSAVRTVSAAAVRNGPVLSAFLAGLRVPGVHLLPERAAGAAVVDGEPCRSLAVAIRPAPRLRPGELALPLAALAAPSPATGRLLVTDLAALADPAHLAYPPDLAGAGPHARPGTGPLRAGPGCRPHALLAGVVRVLVPPALVLLDLGIALEAHGQNTLLVLRAGRPVRVLHRDLGGVRVSPAQLRRHRIEPPVLHGDLATDDPAQLRAKLVGAAMSTVLAQLVAALADGYGEPPAQLWRTVGGTLRACAPQLPTGAGRLLRSLFTGAWPVKAATAMRLAADPLDDVWTELPNPLESW